MNENIIYDGRNIKIPALLGIFTYSINDKFIDMKWQELAKIIKNRYFFINS